MAEWAITLLGQNLTQNRLYASHWGARSKMVEEIVGQCLVLLADAHVPRPIGAPIGVVAVPLVKGRAHLPDVGAHFPWTKAGIDALVRRRCLPDDTPDHVRWILMSAPETGSPAPGLRLVFTTDLEPRVPVLVS